MSNYEIVVATAFGLEGIVKKELKRFDFKNMQVENGKLTFVTDDKGIMLTNLWSRCAERVFIKLGEFNALSFEELFQNIKGIPWQDILPEDANIIVNAKSVKSGLFSLSDIQSISKKAIIEKLKLTYDREIFEENGATFPILIAILNDKVSVLLDTSGVALHKRGYRREANLAPLKETLAAALVILSQWKYDTPFVDPFCGSGTIPIEAALIARNIAPGLNRTFAFENWPHIADPNKWKEIKKEAFSKIYYDKDFEIQGYDLDTRIIKTAISNAEDAGVDDTIHFQARNALDISSKRKYGTIVCNPPYGERLGTKEEVTTLYKNMGKAFSNLDSWNYNILTSEENFETIFRRKSTKNRKLYNGRIRCYYYQYKNHELRK